jgi:hypothetical protein
MVGPNFCDYCVRLHGRRAEYSGMLCCMVRPAVTRATAGTMGSGGPYFLVSHRPSFIFTLLLYRVDGNSISLRNCGSSVPNYTA